METTNKEKQVIIQWTKAAKLMNYAFSKGLRTTLNEGHVCVWHGGQWLAVTNYAEIDEVCK